jgi:hypothetical protein
LITIAPLPFPTKPNLLRVRIEISDDGSMTWTGSHLDYSRTQLVGNAFVLDSIPLRADGYFRTDTLIVEVPGEADCALPDTAVTVALTFEGGQICHQTMFACRRVNGLILGLGVDLNGSTFTFQRIENEVIPEPVLSCERTGSVDRCK